MYIILQLCVCVSVSVFVCVCVCACVRACVLILYSHLCVYKHTMEFNVGMKTNNCIIVYYSNILCCNCVYVCVRACVCALYVLIQYLCLCAHKNNNVHIRFVCRSGIQMS